MITIPGSLNFKTTPVSWNPADKGSNITLSGSNLTVTCAAGTDGFVRATVGKSSGKWYWENTILANSPTGGDNFNIGVAQSGAPVNTILSTNPVSWSRVMFVSANSDKYYNGVLNFFGTAFTIGDVLAIALDMGAGTITTYRNNVSEGVMFSGLTGVIYPAIGSFLGYQCSYATRFAAGSFTYTPPTGFIALTP